MIKEAICDCLHVVWKDPNTRQRFIVGQLLKNDGFHFSYFEDGVGEAIEHGFQPFASFPNTNKEYYSDKLFTAFEIRVPDKKRRDINKILDKYNLDVYDSFNLLKKTQGKLPIDTIEFIDPIFNSKEEVVRDFFIAGTKHWIKCNKDNENCNFPVDLKIGDRLILKKEPDNKFDQYAVEVFNLENQKLGYIPKFHSEAVTAVIDQDRKFKCVVKNIAKDNCHDCIEVTLTIYAIEQ